MTVMRYYHAVQTALSNDYETYRHFVDTMTAYKARQIDALETIKRVCQVLQEHASFIQQFNTIIPVGYSVSVAGVDSGGVETITILTPSGARIQAENMGANGLEWTTVA